MITTYQLGPCLQQIVGIEVITCGCQHRFEQIIDCHLQGVGSVISREVIAELVAMQLPLLAVKIQHRLGSERQAEFDNLFWRGVAYRQIGDTRAAKHDFYAAHTVAPDEIVVHANLAQIFHDEGSKAMASRWLEIALQIDGNAQSLWLIAAQIWSPLKVSEVARQLGSWCGASLVTELTGDVDSAGQIYRQVFDSGERQAEFLIEFTGNLGYRQLFQELTAVAWQLLGGLPLPWQVYRHFEQAFQYLGNTKQAQRCQVLANGQQKLTTVNRQDTSLPT